MHRAWRGRHPHTDSQGASAALRYRPQGCFSLLHHHRQGAFIIARTQGCFPLLHHHRQGAFIIVLGKESRLSIRVCCNGG